MGPIGNRVAEHLGSTDAIIIRTRRQLLDAAKRLPEQGTVPPGVDEPELYGVRSAMVNLPREAKWQEAAEDRLNACCDLPVASHV